jgi:chemotaxis signal transduction protein
LPERELEPSDQLVIVHTPQGPAALIVDRAEVMECGGAAIVPATEFLPDSGFVVGVFKWEDGLILVCDVNALTGFPDDPARITSAISSAHVARQ